MDSDDVCWLLAMPAEILCLIVRALSDPRGFRSCAASCRRLREICQSEHEQERAKLRMLKECITREHSGSFGIGMETVSRTSRLLPNGMRHGLQLVCTKVLWDDGGLSERKHVTEYHMGRRHGFERETINGRLDRERHWVNGQRHGRERWFWPDQLPRLDRCYSDGLLHGPDRRWHQGGFVSHRRLWVRGRREGTELRCWTTGSLFSLRRYRDGLRHGVQQMFYSASGDETRGRLRRRSTWCRGLRHGADECFYRNGKRSWRQKWRQGRRCGKRRRWNQFGRALR